MVVLKNIHKKGNCISADYYPEGGDSKGFMKVSVEDRTILEHHNVSSFSASHVLLRIGSKEGLAYPTGSCCPQGDALVCLYFGGGAIVCYATEEKGAGLWKRKCCTR